MRSRWREARQNKEVAAALFLSPKTVEFHLSRVYRKLDVSSRTELASMIAGERRLTSALGRGTGAAAETVFLGVGEH